MFIILKILEYALRLSSFYHILPGNKNTICQKSKQISSFKMGFLKKVLKFFTVYRLPYEIKPPYTHIVQVGDPVLRTKCQIIKKDELKKREIQDLIDHMKKSIVNNDFVGLSACQVGIPLRIIALHFPQSSINGLFAPKSIYEKQIEPIPLQIWVNPEMKVEDYRTVDDTEQCGSIVSICGDVKRFQKIHLSGLDENGTPKSMIAQGFTARIIQHELDHLDGILYTDKMNPKSLRCTVWQKVNEFNGYVELRYHPKV